MSTTIRTQTTAPQTAPREGFLSRVGRALGELFNPQAPTTAEKVGPDSYVRGTPLSIAAQRRLTLQNSGRGGVRTTAAPSQDAQLVAYLNHISRTGDPSV